MQAVPKAGVPFVMVFPSAPLYANILGVLAFPAKKFTGVTVEAPEIRVPVEAPTYPKSLVAAPAAAPVERNTLAMISVTQKSSTALFFMYNMPLSLAEVRVINH